MKSTIVDALDLTVIDWLLEFNPSEARVMIQKLIDKHSLNISVDEVLTEYVEYINGNAHDEEGKEEEDE
jgi:hypothetical protein